MKTSGLCWLWVSLIVLIIDRWTKTLALQYLVLYVEHPVTRFLNFTLGYNTGSAFGFLNNSSGWEVPAFGVIAAVVSIFIIVWLARLSVRQRWMSVALSLILGGALGNLWDRVSYQHVVDFIQLHISRWYFATFNVADSAICVGAFMLFLEMFFHSKKN